MPYSWAEADELLPEADPPVAPSDGRSTPTLNPMVASLQESDYAHSGRANRKSLWGGRNPPGRRVGVIFVAATKALDPTRTPLLLPVPSTAPGEAEPAWAYSWRRGGGWC